MSRRALIIIRHVTNKKNRYVGLALAITSTLAIGEKLPICESGQTDTLSP